MPSINISLSGELKQYVEAQVKGGAFGNVSEFFRSLIREHQKRAVQERLELLLLEGIESGSAGAMTRSDWDELRAAALRRAESRSKETIARKPRGLQVRTGRERPG